ARLSDVYPSGYAMNLCEGITRAPYRDSWQSPTLLEPGEVYELPIDLMVTSNVFKRGHRIRLDVTSSNFPHFDRNLNTGENNDTSTRIVVAEQTVHHSGRYPSRVILPVVPR